MVFSSIEFIYLFLPPVLLIFHVLRLMKSETAIIWWLILASIGFYMWWKPVYVLLLFLSIGVNYCLHLQLLKKQSGYVFAGGIIFNLGLLVLFKYADFIIGNINSIAEADIEAWGLILPLAISFYTFQQISFLHDTYSGKSLNTDLKRYLLFVTFFPQLIAGPIVLQRDTIPQFRLAIFNNRVALNMAIGATLFLIGLFKKIVLADGIAPVANMVFDHADAGGSVSLGMAWVGSLAYTFQIYFDFSGYCDMALGLARMFGIRLPINFNSPYRSFSIVEFWRRWHITLSRFLRDYLYIALGGNRSGIFGRRGNLLITMLLGGLWHGAGWNFMIWGGLHGSYLIINHAWSSSILKSNLTMVLPSKVYLVATWSLTFLAVVIAWVFFRAETFSGAVNIIHAMFGLASVEVKHLDVTAISAMTYVPMQLCILLLIVLCLPNSIELTRCYRPVIRVAKEVTKPSVLFNWIQWRPSNAWGFLITIIGVTGLIQIYRLNDLTEFIYFNF